MPLTRRFFPVFWIVFLLFAGVAQAQSYHGGTNSQSFEAKAESGNYLRPWQPSLNFDQEAIKGALEENGRQFPHIVNIPINNKPNFKDTTNKKAVGPKNTGLKSELLKPSFRKNSGKNMRPHVGDVGSLPIIQGTRQSGGLGASFLDGYLLNSLQDNGIGRKKETKEKESEDDLPQRLKKVY